MLTLSHDDPVSVALYESIHSGDLEALQRLLAEHSGLMAARIVDDRGVARTPLHIATDWPGYFPNAPAVVTALIERGADPSAPIMGARHAETPLHWAASSDDVDVAEALIAGGAQLEVRRGSIADGTPLDNAVGYGCWQVARLLVARGARVEKLWHAAALGMVTRMEELFAVSVQPTPSQVNEAFWQACHGGKRRAAQYLLARGADVNWMPGYASQTPLQIAGAPDTGRGALIEWLRKHGAR
ncbi:MAG: ankyrin repeat domain-containing protein [Chloroflexota bacterium]